MLGPPVPIQIEMTLAVESFQPRLAQMVLNRYQQGDSIVLAGDMFVGFF